MSTKKYNPVHITVYRWAGSFGPFKIKIPCGECSLTGDIIEDVLKSDLADIPTEVKTFEWLSLWWRPLLRGAWHAPIVLVENQVVSQGVALNRGAFIQAVINAHATHTPIEGNHLFGKDNCSYCQQAKRYLDQAGINYQYHNVIKEPRALYEMLSYVKPIIGPKTPVTVPQIWLDGQYIGGHEDLMDHKF